MAAGALAIQPVVDVVENTGSAVKEKLQELGDHPARFISDGLIKWGTVTFIAGLIAYVLSVASARAAKGYVSDIDNTLGIPQEIPPTPPRKVSPAAAPPAPPSPPVQVTIFNQIVSDVNTLGTISAASNVALFQDILTNLWNLAVLSYGVVAGKPTQTPVDGGNPTGNAQGLGPQLCIAIMETCLSIFELEGYPEDLGKTGPEWNGADWISSEVYTAGGKNKFLSGITAQAQGPFVEAGDADWSRLATQLSLTGGEGVNFKETLNGLAYYLNLSKPFDVSNPGSSSYWGVLGVVVSDLGGIGAEIVQGAQTTGQDIEAAFVQTGKDLNSVVTEIGGGLATIGKALENAPRLAFDSLGYAGSWAGEMILDAIYVPLLALGGTMVGTGLAIRYADRRLWPKLAPRLEIYSEARTAKFWNWVDGKLGTQKAIQEVEAEKPVEIAVQTAAEPPAAIVGQTADEGNSLPSPPAPSVDTPEPPAEPSASVPPPEAPVPTPTAETEEFLGEHPTRAPSQEELKAQEAERVRSLPEPGPTYAQRKEEREHAQAERLLAMGMDWE